MDAVPTAGGIAHTTNEWETPGGGGAVAAVQLAKPDSATFFTATGGVSDIGTKPSRELTSMDVDVRAATRRDSRSRRALALIDRAGERTIITLGDRLAPAAADPLGWDDLRHDARRVRPRRCRRTGPRSQGLVVVVLVQEILRELLATKSSPRRPGGQRAEPSGRPDRSPALGAHT